MKDYLVVNLEQPITETLPIIENWLEEYYPDYRAVYTKNRKWMILTTLRWYKMSDLELLVVRLLLAGYKEKQIKEILKVYKKWKS